MAQSDQSGDNVFERIRQDEGAKAPVLVGWAMDQALLDRIAAFDPRIRLLNRDIPPLPPPDELWPPFPDRLTPLVPHAEILLTLRLPAGVPESTPQLRWIHSQSAGIDYPARAPGLLDANVIITTSSGVHAQPLAETVVGAIIALAKGFPQAVRRQILREWTRYTPGDVAGALVGVIGAGKIGTAVAERCRGMGMRAWGIRRDPGALDPSEPRSPFERLLGPDGLPELLAASDYIVLCAPRTPETLRMLGPEEFSMVKPGACFINVARGDLVVEDALIAALSSGRLGGAYLDVFESEPLPPDSPLWDMPNVLMTAHSGAGSADRDTRVVDLFLENLRRYLDGLPLLNVYDHGRGY